ncbi:MAG: hypothetical protein QOE70_49 [Chthoniobacter sp.]|jgi:hypothetical protein|nr:hypothetical protein [Chthoniobacter sp.]
MNPTDPSNPQLPPPIPPPLTPAPLPPNAGLGVLLDSLLKQPSRLVHELHQAKNSRYLLLLALVALAGFACYGVVIGTFSGGEQLFAAPLKVSLGSLATVLICLPSLYIFACLTGAEVSLRGLAGVLVATLALNALLLLGFAPVAWVFSQSTESVAFIGALHLILWLISLAFGLRLLRLFMDILRVSDRVHVRVWTAIFILVSLQMTTALRPIVGKSEHWLPTEKKFFLAHWAENLFGTRD